MEVIKHTVKATGLLIRLGTFVTKQLIRSHMLRRKTIGAII